MAFSKITYNAFIESVGPKLFLRLDNIRNWFLWSSDNKFDQLKTYVSKFAPGRLYGKVCNFGLGLWDMKSRFEAFKSKTFFWMREKSPVITLWTYHSNVSKYAKVFGKHWEKIKHLPPTVQEYYNAIAPVIVMELYFTPTQKVWVEQFGLDINLLQNQLVRAPILSKVRNLCWRIFSKTLKRDFTRLESDSDNESTDGIFLVSAEPYKNTINDVWSAFSNTVIHWNKLNVFGLTNIRDMFWSTFVFLNLWLLWLVRNNRKHNHVIMSIQEYKNHLILDMERAINRKKNTLRYGMNISQKSMVCGYYHKLGKMAINPFCFLL